MKALSVLGSTGSIGTQTLEIVEDFPDRFRVVALTAGNNLDLLITQIQRHAPEVVALADAERVPELRQRLDALEPAARPAKLPELAVDYVKAGISADSVRARLIDKIVLAGGKEIDNKVPADGDKPKAKAKAPNPSAIYAARKAKATVKASQTKPSKGAEQ